MEAINRLIPSPGNATVKMASEPEGCTEITVPTPNLAWRTFSPDVKLQAAFPAVDAPEAEAPGAPDAPKKPEADALLFPSSLTADTPRSPARLATSERPKRPRRAIRARARSSPMSWINEGGTSSTKRETLL